MRLKTLPRTCLIFLVSLLFIAACQQSQSFSPKLLPLPQDPAIQVYFNHNQAQGAEYQEPYRQLTRSGDNLEEVIITAIEGANSQIDLAIQELNLPQIAQALVERHQAGIKVRVILENTYNQSWQQLTPREIKKLDPRKRRRYQDFIALVDLNQDGQISNQERSQRDALDILVRGGVPIIDDTADGTKGTGLMHHKFLIIDNTTVITGSANFTLSGIHGDLNSLASRGNANHLLKIDSLRLASLFSQEFSFMWGDGVGGELDSKFGVNKPYRAPQKIPIGDSVVTVQFSPSSPSKPWSDSSNGLIGNTLDSAEESINLALFVFSEQKLVNVLEKRHFQGVKISVLIDPNFAFRYYSEALDMLGIELANQCQYEADNHPWQTPIKTVGVPQLAPTDKLHHKFGIIDEKTVITGSQNWSAAANYQNDEVVLVINNYTVTAHFNREFERLYNQAVLGVPKALQTRIQSQKKTCPDLVTPSSWDDIVVELVNVNTASQKQLEQLPGIGEKLASRIISTRQQQPFNSLEDLERVPGIGPHLRQKLEGRVTW